MSYKTILKVNGERVRFSKQKVERSLRRSGATPKLAKSIANAVSNEIRQNTTTDDIYIKAYDMLQEQGIHPTAARYSLKRAIHALGPTGFPFEQFIGRLLSYRGMNTQVGIVIEGRCVSHEVDVLAIDDDAERYIECKFHRDPGYTTNIKVPLYIHSRFQDIVDGLKDAKAPKKNRESWIVTNTHFSDDCMEYARCTGITLVGWNYPEGKGLEKLIEDIGLYPVTVLTHLTERETKKLLDRDIVLCIDLLSDSGVLKDIRIPAVRIQTILNEATELCQNGIYSTT